MFALPEFAVGLATPLSLSDLLFGLLDWLLTDVYGAGLEWFAEAFGVRVLGYPYMQRAYLAVVCIGIVGPLVGTFLVHREMAMIGDTLAHTAFAGVAVGLFANSAFSLSLDPLATALVVAVATALLVELLVEYADAHSDTSLAIVLTGGFAVGSVLITATDGGIAVGIDAYLFGSLATVSKGSVGLLLAMTVLVGGLVAATYRPLLYVTFDETAARAARIDVSFYNRLTVVLTAAVVVSAMQILGVILVAAMLVVPVATAARVARTFKQSLLLAVLAAEFAGIVGVTISYHYGLAAGGSIVLAAIGVYASTLAVRTLPGVELSFPAKWSGRSEVAVEADGGEEE
jgi:zinc transport system permease protein